MSSDTKHAEQLTPCRTIRESSLFEWQHSFLTPKKTVSVSFTNLSYSVKCGIGQGSLNVLHDISGQLSSGELTAIMGPSGAGKSSLMNILAGYTTSGVAGTVYINGEERELKDFSQYSCYIMQDDKLRPQLSIRENMNVAANLKLGEKTSSAKHMQIDRILDALGLSESANTQTLLLSGGERKRLAIGLELINNPPVMFFDEPTSGLDSSSSWHCITLLKMLAQGGRTVICSIHQPSALIFEKFDTLYALANGRCMYQGRISGIIPYLALHDFKCPEYHNPADFLLEVLVGDHGSTHNLCENTCLDSAMELLSDSESTRRNEICTSTSLRSVVAYSWNPQQPEKDGSSVNYHTPFIFQLYILIQRNYLIHMRDRFLIQTRILMHVIIGLLIGMLYYNIGNDAAYIRDNFGFLYFCIMFIQFTAFSAKILTFPLEFPILMREYFNGWYSLKSYFLAAMAADVPVQVLCTLSYTLVTYFLTSQPADIHRLVLFFTVCLLVGLISQNIGVLTGLTMGLQNGMVFGPLAILPFLIFSGFFLSIKDSPWYFQWLFHISYLKYGLEAIMQAMYSYNREKLPCSTVYCHYKQPVKLLEELDMDDAVYWIDVVILTSLYVLLLAVTYVVLMVKLRRR